MYSETWELGTAKGLWETVLNSEVVSFLRSISMYMYCIGLGTEVAVLNSQVVPISQVVLKAGFTVLPWSIVDDLSCIVIPLVVTIITVFAVVFTPRMGFLRVS